MPTERQSIAGYDNSVPHDAPPEIPSPSTPLAFTAFALIIIRRGDSAGGKHTIRLTIENPAGEVKALPAQEIEMPKFPNGAVTARARIGLKLQSKGTYWISVFLDKKFLTKMALNVLVNREEPPNDNG